MRDVTISPPEPARLALLERRLRRQEATMELSMRLSLLAALMSFGFLAAIVVGMV